MKKQIHFVVSILLVTLALLFTAKTAIAQDPVKVDSKHYKVEVENAWVRVLRINYGPKEKSVMHKHPAGVVVYLTDQNAKFNFTRRRLRMTACEYCASRWGLTRRPQCTRIACREKARRITLAFESRQSIFRNPS